MQGNQTVLCLYPNRKGIAYTLFNSPEQLIEFGIYTMTSMSPRISLKKIKEYLDHFKPDVVITRNINDLNSNKSKRIQLLINTICKEAKNQNCNIHSYTRSQIKQVFEEFGITTKHQISEKIIRWFDQLKPYGYPKRKQWMSEHYNAGIFDAVSLGVVYWYKNT